MTKWEALIDEAAEKCGGQNALGRRLGIPASRMSDARHGRKRLNREHVAEVASILNISAADLWLAQEDLKNPFRVVETALVALMSALFLFTLPSESRASARVSAESPGIAHAVSEQPRYT